MESEGMEWNPMAMTRGMASTPLERPIRIGTHMVKNRFVIQPMECGDSNLRGGFSEDTLQRYENLFRGGAGVVGGQTLLQVVGPAGVEGAVGTAEDVGVIWLHRKESLASCFKML